MKLNPNAMFPLIFCLFSWTNCQSFSFQLPTVRRQIPSYSKKYVMNDDHLLSEDGLRSKARRDFFGYGGAVAVAIAPWSSSPSSASARYVLDDETGDYVEVEDTDWQTAWKQRLDKASTMSTDEIFQAARGAGNVELRDGPESNASKKRRAMSACRDATIRSKANAGSEKECTARVFAGEVDFLLEALSKNNV